MTALVGTATPRPLSRKAPSSSTRTDAGSTAIPCPDSAAMRRHLSTKAMLPFMRSGTGSACCTPSTEGSARLSTTRSPIRRRSQARAPDAPLAETLARICQAWTPFTISWTTQTILAPRSLHQDKWRECISSSMSIEGGKARNWQIRKSPDSDEGPVQCVFQQVQVFR